jgi:RecB family exonuclease
LRGTLAHFAFEHVFNHDPSERTRELALSYVEPAWRAIVNPLIERSEVIAGSPEDRLRVAEKRYRDLHEPGSKSEADLLSEAESALTIVAAEQLEEFLASVCTAVAGWFAMENPSKFTPTERELYVRASCGKATVHGFIDRLDVIADSKGSPRTYVSDYKGLALDTPLPTPTGWTTMERVRVGDELIGVSGYPVVVTEKTPEQRLNCYKLVFDDGGSIIADEVHLWPVLPRDLGLASTADLPALLERGPVLLPALRPVALPQVSTSALTLQQLSAIRDREHLSPLDPAFIGLLRIARSSQDQRLELMRSLLGEAAELSVRDASLTGILSEVAILSGLGPLRWRRNAGISTASLVLPAHGVDVSTPRVLVAAQPVGTVTTQCVAVDAPDGLYLAGRSMVPTHNTGKKPGERFRDEAFFQLEVYALALEEAQGVKTDQLRLIYTNEANEQGILKRTVTPELLAKTRRKLLSVWNGIEQAHRNDVWPTRRQRLCDWCYFKDVCPAWRPELEGLLPEEIELRLSKGL